MELTLVMRAYCHLCDEMRDDLARLLASSGAMVDVVVVDVDADPALESRWGDKVPVLLGGGQELCHYLLDAGVVARWMQDAAGAVSR